METFGQGLLSGIGHPLLGFDHLFFVVAVGVCALWVGRGRVAPLGYIVAMLLGCLLVALGYSLPLVETVVVLSLLTLGGLLLSVTLPGLRSVIGLFAVFGLFHGAAFGESIAAQESVAGLPVLIGYLLGLGVIQYLIAVVAGRVIAWVGTSMADARLAPRFAGAMVAGAGLLMALEQIEGPLLRVIAL